MTGDDVKKDIIGTLGAADSAPQSHDSNDNMNTDVRAGRLPTLSRSERAGHTPLCLVYSTVPFDRWGKSSAAHIRARDTVPHVYHVGDGIQTGCATFAADNSQ